MNRIRIVISTCGVLLGLTLCACGRRGSASPAADEAVVFKARMVGISARDAQTGSTASVDVVDVQSAEITLR